MTFDATQFETRLATWLAGAQKLITDKYIRVWRVGAGDSRSCHCFIDTTNGNVLKSAGWKAPEKKNPRGNLFDEKNGLGMMGIYGTAYLK